MDIDNNIKQQILAAAREIRRQRKENRRARKAQQLKNIADFISRKREIETRKLLRKAEEGEADRQRLAEQEDKRNRLIRAEVRYLYSTVPMEEVCAQLGLEGREVREHLRNRMAPLRVRWPTPCQHPEN